MSHPLHNVSPLPTISHYFSHFSSLSTISTATISGVDNVGDLLTLVVAMALELKSAKRELGSRLIADLYGSVIAPKYMEDAFVVLLKQVKNIPVLRFFEFVAY